jgi:hypothetical protein
VGTYHTKLIGTLRINNECITNKNSIFIAKDFSNSIPSNHIEIKNLTNNFEKIDTIKINYQDNVKNKTHFDPFNEILTLPLKIDSIRQELENIKQKCK